MASIQEAKQIVQQQQQQLESAKQQALSAKVTFSQRQLRTTSPVQRQVIKKKTEARIETEKKRVLEAVEREQAKLKPIIQEIEAAESQVKQQQERRERLDVISQKRQARIAQEPEVNIKGLDVYELKIPGMSPVYVSKSVYESMKELYGEVEKPTSTISTGEKGYFDKTFLERIRDPIAITSTATASIDPERRGWITKPIDVIKSSATKFKESDFYEGAKFMTSDIYSKLNPFQYSEFERPPIKEFYEGAEFMTSDIYSKLQPVETIKGVGTISQDIYSKYSEHVPSAVGGSSIFFKDVISEPSKEIIKGTIPKDIYSKYAEHVPSIAEGTGIFYADILKPVISPPPTQQFFKDVSYMGKDIGKQYWSFMEPGSQPALRAGGAVIDIITKMPKDILSARDIEFQKEEYIRQKLARGEQISDADLDAYKKAYQLRKDLETKQQKEKLSPFFFRKLRTAVSGTYGELYQRAVFKGPTLLEPGKDVKLTKEAELVGKGVGLGTELGSLFVPGVAPVYFLGGPVEAGLKGQFVEYAKEEPFEVAFAGLYGLGKTIQIARGIGTKLGEPVITSEKLGIEVTPNYWGAVSKPQLRITATTPTGEPLTKEFYEFYGGGNFFQPGSKTQLTTKFRNMFGLPAVYEGSPYGPVGKEQYKQSLNLLTKRGYTLNQAKNILRLRRPIFETQALSGVAQVSYVGEQAPKLEYVGGEIIQPIKMKIGNEVLTRGGKQRMKAIKSFAEEIEEREGVEYFKQITGTYNPLGKPGKRTERLFDVSASKFISSRELPFEDAFFGKAVEKYKVFGIQKRLIPLQRYPKQIPVQDVFVGRGEPALSLGLESPLKITRGPTIQQTTQIRKSLKTLTRLTPPKASVSRIDILEPPKIKTKTIPIIIPKEEPVPAYISSRGVLEPQREIETSKVWTGPRTAYFEDSFYYKTPVMTKGVLGHPTALTSASLQLQASVTKNLDVGAIKTADLQTTSYSFKQIQGQATRQRQAQREGLRLAEKQAYAQVSRFRLSPSQRPRARQNLSPKKLQKKFPIIIPLIPLPYDKSAKPIKKKSEELFIPEVRRRKVWTPLGQFTTFEKSLRRGREEVLGSLAASFRLKQRGGRIVPIKPSKYFRPSKTMPGALIQIKRGMGAYRGRLSSPLERKEIQYWKRLKK